MLLKNFGCACAAIFIVVGAARAHGPQMQITATEGQIVTRSILTDVYEPLTSPKSAYVMEVLDYRGVWYARPETALNPPDHPSAPGEPVYYSGPGLAYGVDQTFAVGSTLSINFAMGLKLWNGSAFTDAGSAELQYFRGGSIGASGQLVNPSASILTGDDGPSSPLSFGAIAAGYDAEAHTTARLRFLGDGTTTTAGSGPQAGTIASEPVDGVYLATFVLTSSEPTLAASEPFFFLMHKGVPWSEVSAAVSSLNLPNSAVQVLGVPEPAALCLTVFGTLAFVSRRRTFA